MASGRGIEPADPTVYGIRGSVKTSSVLPGLDQVAGVHHQHPVGDPGHHPEVVGDQDDRRDELRPCTSLELSPGSAPAR